METTFLKKENNLDVIREFAKPRDWKELNGLFDEGTEITIVERTYKKILQKKVSL